MPESSSTVLLSAYAPPAFLIERVELSFDLHPTATKVISRLFITPPTQTQPLLLDGDGLVIAGVMLDNVPLSPESYEAKPDSFLLKTPPSQAFTLTFETVVNPQDNTALSGLYLSGGIYTTQCEAQGFRRITYFLDRPDVLSTYTVKIIADAAQAPVLLSNGNPVEKKMLEDGRHVALWHDPHPKPCYLFALVAGDLAGVFADFTTRDGRAVKLGVYVLKGKQGRASFALEALESAMRFDEEVYGRCYDLDVFNIVAVPDFNMGAMENKGLNIFNDKYVLADLRTATDHDYTYVDAIIAHEYFHNWTGNRITCRDWFQLCLKEGLTVYREQSYMAMRRGEAVARISDVRRLKSQQFAEDAGPLAHPVRPSSYGAIDNLYTSTVYEKGAEIVRVLRTWIGDQAFFDGLTLFFERFDGQAVTVEDFLGCFAQTSGKPVMNLMRWYEQAGTPEVQVASHYQSEARRLTLTFKQNVPARKNNPDPKPVLIPLKIGLLDRQTPHALREEMVQLEHAETTISFDGLQSAPVLSLNRGFGVPILVHHHPDDEELGLLSRHDSDPFNRWQALQQYAMRSLLHSVRHPGVQPSQDLIGCFRDMLRDERLLPALRAEMLILPTEAEIGRELAQDVDPDAVYAARSALRKHLTQGMEAALVDLVHAAQLPKSQSPDPAAIGQRALALSALDLLVFSAPRRFGDLAFELFEKAGSLTVRLGTLSALVRGQAPEAERALAAYQNRYSDEPLVMDKWFALQASQPSHNTLHTVMKLVEHPDFTLKNPNRARAVIASFAHSNIVGFHRPDGAGYRFVLDMVEALDAINPQVAARMMTAFNSWRSVEPKRRSQALKFLDDFKAKSLSKDLRDIVERVVSA